MRERRHRRFVVATLLIAALGVHVDLPRLHLSTSLGDTLNAIRVSDPVSHILLSRLVDNLPDGAELGEQLEEGRESLELLTHTPHIDAILPPGLMRRMAADTDPVRFDNGAAGLFGVDGLAGHVLNIDLPPPRWQALCDPPGRDAPSLFSQRFQARGPPLR